MTKKQLNLRISDLAHWQIDQLVKWWGTSQTEALSIIIDRIYQQELERRTTIDKPKPNKEIAIHNIHRNIRGIIFDASIDAIDDLRQFGRIEFFHLTNEHRLIVDARYDLEEVIKYIEEYSLT